MTHPIDRIELKLARAETHLEAIRQAVEAITVRSPDLIPGEFDRREHRYVFRATRDSAEGDWLSPLIGDCVHNFRAALDYLAWELSSPAYRASHPTSIEFPIFVSREGYDGPNGAARRIRGIDPAAQLVIKCLQPFNGPGCRPDFSFAHPTEKPLWRLAELDNWDKHRSLNLTEDVASMRFIGFEQLSVIVPREPIRHGGAFERGTPLVTAMLALGNPAVDVQLEATYDIAFDPRGPESVVAEPVLRTLDEIRDEVRFRILGGLGRFLPPR